MDTNNNFEYWFKKFSERSENLTEQSLKSMLELAYMEGFKQCEREMPLYGKTEDGTIVALPREDNESLLPKGEKYIDEDFDVDAWLLKKKEEKNAGD